MQNKEVINWFPIFTKVYKWALYSALSYYICSFIYYHHFSAMMFMCTPPIISHEVFYKDVLLNMLPDVWWNCECISESHIVPSMINVIVTGFLPIVRWTGLEPSLIVKWMALEKMSSWGQSMHITADWRAYPFSLLDTVLIDTASIFPVKKGPCLFCR